MNFMMQNYPWSVKQSLRVYDLYVMKTLSHGYEKNLGFFLNSNGFPARTFPGCRPYLVRTISVFCPCKNG